MRNDYIMDMIEDFGEFLLNLKAKMTYNEDFSTVNHDASLGEAGLVGMMLKRMSLEGRINEAENILFDTLYEHPEADYFYVAMDFYKELSEYPEEFLSQHNFSKEEIKSAIEEIIDLAAQNGITKEQF